MNQDVKLLEEFKTCPAVFAVGDKYQIMTPVKSDLLFWVNVNGRDYHDHSNGIIRSSVRMHRVEVPMSELDAAGEYTVCYRKIIERKPYRSTTQEPVSATYKFRPLPETGRINIYQLADTHGRFDRPAVAASYFGDDIDLLVLNGDVPDHSGDVANFDLIYRLCEAATGGGVPCIFSRGNHDTRGVYAENIADYTPVKNGKSYFSFRLGRVWGLVLDCGEDKRDDHIEYGHTVCCHEFRLDETEYLRSIIASPETEYAAPGVEYRLVFAHNPFTHRLEAPFDIEQDTFREWAELLKENVKPHALISGHLHTLNIGYPGGELDNTGFQFSPVIVGSRPTKESYIGCAITLDGDNMDVKFTDNEHNVVGGELVKL